MTQFGFGQPMSGIIQMAYVVADIREAIAYWTRDLRAGPFFLLDHFPGMDAIYRGRPTNADVAIAMGFAGHMLIELIQPNDDQPSVYKEVIEQRGYGFHHFGVASMNVEADIPVYEARGYQLAYTTGVPTGGRVAYLDGGPAQPGMLELLPVTTGMDEAFTSYWRASLDWNGDDPIRSFA